MNIGNTRLIMQQTKGPLKKSLSAKLSNSTLSTSRIAEKPPQRLQFIPKDTSELFLHGTTSAEITKLTKDGKLVANNPLKVTKNIRTIERLDCDNKNYRYLIESPSVTGSRSIGVHIPEGESLKVHVVFKPGEPIPQELRDILPQQISKSTQYYTISGLIGSGAIFLFSSVIFIGQKIYDMATKTQE